MENRQCHHGFRNCWIKRLKPTKQHLLEMNKLRADQALAAIALIEEKIVETERIAREEID